MKLTASMLKTASTLELDILARAQMMEGIAGNPVNTAVKLFNRGSSGMLVGIERLAKSISESANPLWWERKDTGLYRAARAAAASINKGAADDILQNVMLGVNADGETIEAAFHYTGKFVSKTPGLMDDFKAGDVAPNDGRILKGVIRGVRQKALDTLKGKEKKNLSLDAQREQEGGAQDFDALDTGEATTNMKALEALMDNTGSTASGLVLELLNSATKPHEYGVYKTYLRALEYSKSEKEAQELATDANGVEIGTLYVQRTRAQEVLKRLIRDKDPGVMKILNEVEDLGFYKDLTRGRPMMATTVEAKAKKVSEKDTKAEAKPTKGKGVDQFKKLLDKLTAMVENGDIKADDVIKKIEGMTKLSSDQKLAVAVLKTASQNPKVRAELIGVVRTASIQ